MKILFCPCHYIYDEENLGSEVSWAFNIANRIAMKYKSSIVVTGVKNLAYNKKYKIIELQKNKQSIDFSVKNALIFNLKYFRETKKQVRKQNIDVIHHVGPFQLDTTFNLFFILNKTKIPLILGPLQTPLHIPDKDINNTDLKKISSGNKKLELEKLIKFIFNPLVTYLSNKTLQKATRIIVISGHTRDQLIKRNVSKNKIFVIPPGIDTRKFPYNKKNKRIKLVVTGYLLKRKGVDLILKAIAEVVKSIKDIELIIIGDGPQMDQLRKLSIELNITSNVIFVGMVSNSLIRNYYSNVHIFISMSRSESWGQMYLEAMACGLPVITSRTVGSESIIKDGITGYLVEQEDYHALAEKIIYLFNNKHEIATLGRKARNEVEKKYDWEKAIIPQYLAVYDSLK